MSSSVVSRIAEGLSDGSPGFMERALDTVREEFGAERVSLALVRGIEVEMLPSVGRPLLADGASVASDSSSLFDSAAHGEMFRGEHLDRSPGFVRPVDQLMIASGFRSAWAVPVRRGGLVAGVLSMSHLTHERASDRCLSELCATAGLFALPIEFRQQWLPPRILVCSDNPLVGGGIARMLEDALQADVEVACTLEELEALEEEFDVVVSDVVVFGCTIALVAAQFTALRRSRLVVCSRYDTEEQRTVAKD